MLLHVLLRSAQVVMGRGRRRVQRHRPLKVPQRVLPLPQRLPGQAPVGHKVRALGRQRDGAVHQVNRVLRLLLLQGDYAQQVQRVGVFGLLGQQAVVERLGALQFAAVVQRGGLRQALGGKVQFWGVWHGGRCTAP